MTHDLTRRQLFGRLAAIVAGTAVVAAVPAPPVFQKPPTELPAEEPQRFVWNPYDRPIHDKQTGLSMRFIREYDATKYPYRSRFDVLYGVGTIRPEMAVRVISDDDVDIEGARSGYLEAAIKQIADDIDNRLMESLLNGKNPYTPLV